MKDGSFIQIARKIINIFLNLIFYFSWIISSQTSFAASIHEIDCIHKERKIIRYLISFPNVTCTAYIFVILLWERYCLCGFL